MLLVMRVLSILPLNFKVCGLSSRITARRAVLTDRAQLLVFWLRIRSLRSARNYLISWWIARA